MKRYSIWKDNIKFNEFNKLEDDLFVDVLIIGGGITGVSTLYHLRNCRFKVALVEQNRIGMGITANTTGKVTYLQDKVYNELLTNFGFDMASLYLKSQRNAIEIILEIIKKGNISCDLVKSDSYVFTNKEKEIKKISCLKNFLEDNNVKVFENELKFIKNLYSISVCDTYLFNPLKFVDGILKKCAYADIYENTAIEKIEKKKNKYICYTNKNKIISTRVVVASHYPFFNLPFLFPLKGNLEKSYVVAGKRKVDNISLISYDKPVVSLRNYKDYIIFLGESDNISNNVEDDKKFRMLIDNLKLHNFNHEYLWTNSDIITNDYLPYIGKIADNMYIGTGYNTWGMTNGVLAGKIISDLILDKDNEYQQMFNPKRMNAMMFGMGIIDAYYNINGFIKGSFAKNDVLYDVVDGKKIAIFIDDSGEHKVYLKCPHMGCDLIFNKEEKTWDCPCHASRFDIDGNCISGPSNKNICINDN